MKLPVQYRTFEITRAAVDEKARTIELSFSSEEPVSRYFDQEILDHSPESVRLGRLENGGPILVGHDLDDHVGIVESVSIDKDRRGRAVARLGSSARAVEIFKDVVDGIRHAISFGYRVHSMVLESRGDGDTDDDVYRSYDWEPFEISLVSVPADATVGVGRGDAGELLPVEIYQVKDGNPNPTGDAPANAPASAAAPAAPAPVDIQRHEQAGQERERARIKEINELGRAHNMQDLADSFIDSGRAVHEFTAEILKAQRDIPRIDVDPTLGLTNKEARSFSLVRALDSLAHMGDHRKREAAAFEFECSRAVADKLGCSPSGIMMPTDVMRLGLMDSQRDLSAGAAAAGGHTVATDLLAQSFIELLRNRTVVMEAGATVLGDLVGNVAIPRQTAGATGYWISTEGGGATESQQTFDQVTLTPKTAGALTEYTRQLLLQSSIDIEAFVRGDIDRVLAILIDLAGLYGSGASGQPTGVANTTGINAPTKFAAADPTYAEVVRLETDVDVDNALMGGLTYVTDPAMRGAFKTTEKASGTAQFIWEPGNTVNGYPCLITGQVTDGDVFFGNFADLLIGMWGGLDVTVDPFTGSNTGTVRIVALQSMDLGVRHPASFAFNNDEA